MDLNRRALLVTGAVAASGTAVSLRANAASFGVAELIALSSRLTGRLAADFDEPMAARILQHLQARGLQPQLQRLAAAPDAASPLAAELVATWYSGVCQAVAGPQVVGFSEALLWRSASFLHAPGSCGGATNYWARPPEA